MNSPSRHDRTRLRRRSTPIALAGCLAVWGGALLAQNPVVQFTDLQNAPRLPVERAFTSAFGVGDVDGDGDADVVLGDFRGLDKLYLNDGRRRFVDSTQGRLPQDGRGTTGLALVDVDGDTDLDVVLAKWGAQNRLYLNDGSGRFIDATVGRMPVDTHLSSALAVGDVDGDGDADLMFGGGTSCFPCPGDHHSPLM